METQQPHQNQWYDKKVILIILFFLFPPLGIYGILKHKTDTWKKLLYIIPSILLMLILISAIVGSSMMDSYKTGLDYYNKKEYTKAYEFFEMVKPDNENYNDAVAKMEEIRPIVDSLNALAVNQKMEEKESRDREKEIAKNPSLAFPQMQQNFLKVINDYKKMYEDAPNELKKSALRTERGIKLKEILNNSRKFDSWFGTVTEMRTTSKGNAHFAIEIDGTSISMGTMNSELSDLMDKSLITQNNPLFNVISELKEGDKVLISGEFLDSSKKDFVLEASLTEEGSMKNPDFLVKFTNVSKR